MSLRKGEFSRGTFKPLGGLSHLTYVKHTILCAAVRKESARMQATISFPLLSCSPQLIQDKGIQLMQYRVQRASQSTKKGQSGLGEGRQAVRHTSVRSCCPIYDKSRKERLSEGMWSHKVFVAEKVEKDS